MDCNWNTVQINGKNLLILIIITNNILEDWGEINQASKEGSSAANRTRPSCRPSEPTRWESTTRKTSSRGVTPGCRPWQRPLSAPSWHAARVSIGLSLAQTPPPPSLSLRPFLPRPRQRPCRSAACWLMRVWHTLPGTSAVWAGGDTFLFLSPRKELEEGRGEGGEVRAQNRCYIWCLSIKKAFLRGVYSRRGAEPRLHALVIDSNYISHWLARTFIFASISLINSISMMIEIEFDEC